MKDAIILFKFASRSRPQKFKEAMESILSNINQPELARFLFTFDENDPQKENYNKVLDELKTLNHVAIFGESKSKIHACNRNLEEAHVHFPEWKILVCMSDDMKFIVKGFDDVIRESFTEEDLAIHFPDQNQGEKCMTMSIMDRKYFERRGYIYHPDYISVECDLEAQEEAQMLGRYRFVEQRIFNHNHPSFGQAEYDAQYQKTEAYAVHEADKATRRRRKADNYGLHKSANSNLYKMWHLAESEILPEPTAKEKVLSILKKAMEEIEAL